MDLKAVEQVERLVNVAVSAGLSVLEVQDDRFRVRIETVGNAAKQIITETVKPSQDDKQPEQDHTVYKYIKSPMVGAFSLAGTPKEVKVGDNVKVGDLVCSIEAMKLLNTVEATESGEIVEIMVKSGEMVEYDQPLIKLI